MIWVNTFTDRQCSFHIGNKSQTRFVGVGVNESADYTWRFFVLFDALNYYQRDMLEQLKAGLFSTPPGFEETRSDINAGQELLARLRPVSMDSYCAGYIITLMAFLPFLFRI